MQHEAEALHLGCAQENKAALDESSLVDKAVAKVSGKRRKVEERVELNEASYEENLRAAREHLDSIHEEANEYVRTHELYESEVKKMTQELADQ